ncbi:ABC transporter G family member 25-like [Panicum virgatum]|uniref:ABC transporter domain-containing protein n=1 Tax=Panicum virgatum TaxID=38727 RepID=A0A8T0PEV1_PANVG|nr:ABC transporter G family member 25-like [Panicum virgatum]KAG2560651.1 hypothetical protein PVAP13_8KG075968 [Panicum virgatum]
MPPNAHDAHGSAGGLPVTAAAANKMDCFLTTACTPLHLQFIDVSYRVKQTERSAPPGRISSHSGGACSGAAAAPEERTILRGVTGEARPGEVLAVLGPSGSGKSTLLSILGGRLAGRHGGTVLAGGRPPSCRGAARRRTGFVAQDDVLHPHLTVRETLVFCAMLRLPRAAPAAAKAAAAEAVIAELGLAACADTAVGNAFVRGVSGGERKRVSIGHEMLVNPSLLILDEPTSGLDSTAAARLLATLSALARKGRTVVMSVHQPSSRVYRMFDSVLLLAEGSCLYFGAGRDAMDYFASVGFAPGFHVNPADFMLDLANGFAQADYNFTAEGGNVKQSLISSYNKVLAPRVKASINAAAAEHALEPQPQPQPPLAESCSGCTSWANQFMILLRRSLKERRHEAFTSLRVFQILAPALVAGAMWWRSSPAAVQDRLGLLFFVSIFWGVFASFNAVFAIPQERPVLARERASGMYALSSYFMARMAGDLPMELALPAAFTVVVYLMAGLNPAPAAFALTLAVILSYVLVAGGLGLAVGAAMMDAKRASTLVTVVMLAFLLTGGFYVHNVPGFMAWAKYTSFTYYCYRLLIAVQYGGHLRRLLPPEAVDGEAGPGACVAALAAMLFGYRLLAYLALRRVRK